MNPDRWKRVESLYEAATELAGPERAALLERECRGDTDLRAEIESLLDAEGEASGFLEKPAFIIPTPPPLKSLPADEPGSMVGRRIGSYRITGVIGSGGMGVVYLAEQEFPRRIVALKVVKPSLASDAMIRRFEHEAEILGRLQHPGIAQIYEAGAAPDHENPLGSGVRAFFAMEYVKGSSITEYARARALSTTQRLELFARVCDAVQHAHQKGVIHRDLKPANILVDESSVGPAPGGTNPAAAQPKVLDFGVARVTDSDRRVTTMRTSVGQLIGTLPYMSPEQVAGDQEGLDTRSDVYALGVILYELLSGKLPHDLTSRSIPEAARIIRDDAPARLSSISRVFRGEIDTIVAKAIEKDRARRYQSASDLADDLRRHLAGEPIAAKRDSALYVLRKQLNRYRGVVAIAALFVISLVVFSVMMFFQSQENRALAIKAQDARDEAVIDRQRAEHARDEAVDQRARAAINSRRLQTELTASTIERGRMSGLLGNVSLAEELLWTEFLRAPSSPHAYWALWELFTREPCLWTLRPHTNYVTGIALSADQGTIVSCSRDARLAAIDTASHTLAAMTPAGEKPYYAIAASPRDPVIAAAGAAGTIEFRADRTLDHLGCIDARQGELNAVAFSPDGALLATGGADSTIKVWSVTRDLLAGAPTEPPLLIFGHKQRIVGLAFGAAPGHDPVLASTSDDQSCRVWNSRTGELIATMLRPAPLTAAVAISPDGSRIALGSLDRTVRLFDTMTGVMWWSNSRLNGTIRSIAFSRDGDSIYAGGWYFIERLDTATSEAEYRPLGHTDRANAMALTADGKMLFSASDDGSVKAWETTTLACRSNLDIGASGSPGVAFTADDRLLISGGRAPEVRITDARTGERVLRLGRFSGQPRSIRLSPDGTRVAVGNGSGDVQLLDTNDWSTVLHIKPHRSNIVDLVFTPEGDRLASLCSDRTMTLTDLRTGECVWNEMPFEAEALRMAMSPDGKTIAATSRSSFVLVFDAETGQCRASLPTKFTPWSIAYSTDGSTLFSGNWGNEIVRWDAETLEQLPPLRGHSQTVYALAPGPSGRLIASGSQDTTVKLWDVWSGQCVATLEGGRVEVLGLIFSHTGRQLAAWKVDGTVDVWDLTHYRKHIAGNIDSQLALREKELPADFDRRLLDAWSKAQWAERIDDQPLK